MIEAQVNRSKSFNSDVFASQELYRLVLQSLSRPGEIQHLSKNILEGLSLNQETSMSSNVYIDALALMVLDPKIGFYLPQKFLEAAKAGFYAKRQSAFASADQADIIFMPALDDCETDTILQAKAGTLFDPHCSASVFVALQRLSDTASAETPHQIILKGPGIKDKNTVFVSSLEAFQARQERNDEYPCGIDMIFVDRNGNLFALPRTTELCIVRGDK